MNTDKQYKEELFTHINALVEGEKKVTLSNIIYVATELVKIVEKYKLPGTNKKQLVLDTLTSFVENTLEEDEYPKELIDVISTVLPHVIDTMISIDKGEIVIAIRKGCTSLFRCCKK